ncbi:MAG: protein kinase, partial [Cyanobacteria bacterium]|nr:protein kinase [Cyanobacteriota bacterium]
LLDFGLAKNFAAGSTATGNGAPSSSDTKNPPSSTAADLTMGTAIIGTPNYMSPEQCLNKPLDARSDIYSLSCVLFECATGRQPFAAGSDLAVMNNHLHQTPTFEKSDKVPDDIKEIILRGLSKDPQARFQSAAELSAALQKASFESNKAKFSVIIITAVAVTALCVLAASAYLNYGHNRKLNSADAAIKQKEKSKLDRLGTIQMDAEEMNEAGHSAKRDHPSLGSDYDKAEQLFIASRRLAVSQGKKFIAAKDSLDLGFTYIENHKLDKAEEPLVTALREFQPLEPSITLSHQIANCYLGLGNLRKFQGRPEEAYAYHKKASEIWPAEEHERKYAVTLRLLEDLIDLQKYDEAKKFGNQVLKDLGPIEDSEKPLYREKVWTQVMMAELDLTTNDETSANQRIDDLLAISQHEKNYGYTIDSMFNLARKATNQHRYRLALKILDKSKLYIGSRDHDKKRWDRAKKMTELVYAKMENSSDKSHSRLHRIGSLSPEDLLHRALSYRAKHEYRDALDLMEEAKEAARLRKDFQAENMIKYEIANTYQKLAMDPKADEELKREGNVSNIISIYNDVLEQRKQLGYNENTSKIYWQLGVIYLKQRKLDKAITTLQLAVKTAKDAESPNDWIMGDIELLQAYVDKNDIKHAFETGEELKKLIDEFGLSKENNWIQIRSTMVLASLHLNHGSPTKAMEEVENLISIFRTIPTNEIPARACAELAVHAVARKQYKMAKKLADYILSRPGVQENESIPIAQSVVKVLKEKGSY